MHTITRKLRQRGQWQRWWWSRTGFSNSKIERFQEGHQKVCYFQLSISLLVCFPFLFPETVFFSSFFSGYTFFSCMWLFLCLAARKLKENWCRKGKNFWILSRFDVLVLGNCNAWLIWAEIVVPNLVLEFSMLWVPFGTYKFCSLIPYFS